MAVNALVTGMIVFRILKVTRGSKFRRIMFIIIESGMTSFAFQLLQVVLVITCILLGSGASLEVGRLEPVEPFILVAANSFVVVINQILNVIILSVHFYFFCFADNQTFACQWLGYCTYNNFGASSNLNEVVLR